MLYMPVERLEADLDHLAAAGATGEFIAEAAGVEVRVFLLGGRLAWATSSADRTRLTNHLVERHGIDRARIRTAVAESQRTNRSFAEVLVDQEIATRDQVREMLLVHIARTLVALASLRSPRVSFTPRRLSYPLDLTFALAEVQESVGADVAAGTARSGWLSDAGPESRGLVLPSADQSAAESGRRKAASGLASSGTALGSLHEVAGFIGACLFDSDACAPLGVESVGTIDIELACALEVDVVRALRAAMHDPDGSDDVEDVLIALGEQYHLIRPMKSRPALFFYVVLDRSGANLALARLTLAAVERAMATSMGGAIQPGSRAS